MIGYIYCITNNITEETYIGRHNYKENEYKYTMIFKPESIVPIDLEYKSGEEVLNGVVN